MVPSSVNGLSSGIAALMRLRVIVGILNPLDEYVSVIFGVREWAVPVITTAITKSGKCCGEKQAMMALIGGLASSRLRSLGSMSYSASCPELISWDSKSSRFGTVSRTREISSAASTACCTALFRALSET